jgi:hypothetical protein
MDIDPLTQRGTSISKGIDSLNQAGKDDWVLVNRQDGAEGLEGDGVNKSVLSLVLPGKCSQDGELP